MRFQFEVVFVGVNGSAHHPDLDNWLFSLATKSNKCSFFTNSKGFFIDRKDLQALTLVGPTRENAVSEPPSWTTPWKPTIYKNVCK